MAEDEDPQIAAVLAKLAGQDAAAAEDARAALEWIAGDQDLVFITQQRIQNFCWYDLPVKWLIDLDDKLRVVAALAQALDLLQLPRYAAVCRSGTTRRCKKRQRVGVFRMLLNGLLGSCRILKFHRIQASDTEIEVNPVETRIGLLRLQQPTYPLLTISSAAK